MRKPIHKKYLRVPRQKGVIYIIYPVHKEEIAPSRIELVLFNRNYGFAYQPDIAGERQSMIGALEYMDSTSAALRPTTSMREHFFNAFFKYYTARRRNEKPRIKRATLEEELFQLLIKADAMNTGYSSLLKFAWSKKRVKKLKYVRNLAIRKGRRNNYRSEYIAPRARTSAPGKTPREAFY